MPAAELVKSAALLVVGHGSTVNPDSSAPTLRHASDIRRRGVFAEVACCFWKEQPALHDGLHLVESDTVFVVPNFISEGYFTRTVVPREMGLAGEVTRRGRRTIFYCEPVGNHPWMTEALLKRAREAAPGIPPSETTLLIVGHGTALNDNSARAAKERVRAIRELGLYAQVEAAYMEEPPLISDWDKIATQDHVVAVPFFIADGLHSYQDIPILLGMREEAGPAASEAVERAPRPHQLRGKTLCYALAIGTEPMFADIIIEQAMAAALRHPGGA